VGLFTRRSYLADGYHPAKRPRCSDEQHGQEYPGKTSLHYDWTLRQFGGDRHGDSPLNYREPAPPQDMVYFTQPRGWVAVNTPGRCERPGVFFFVLDGLYPSRPTTQVDAAPFTPNAIFDGIASQEYTRWRWSSKERTW